MKFESLFFGISKYLSSIQNANRYSNKARFKRKIAANCNFTERDFFKFNFEYKISAVECKYEGICDVGRYIKACSILRGFKDVLISSFGRGVKEKGAHEIGPIKRRPFGFF